MSDLFGNHIVGFPTSGSYVYMLNQCFTITIIEIDHNDWIYEPVRDKTNNLGFRPVLT